MNTEGMQDWFVDYINSVCSSQFHGSIECEVSETKGRILIAKRAFSKGDLIFEEQPLHFAVADNSNEAFLAVERLCAEDPDAFSLKPLWYWAALSSLTVEDSEMHGSLKPVTPDQQKQILCLYHEPVTKASKATRRIVRTLGLKVSPIKLEELLQAWILNCFEHSEDPEGYSAYFVSSMMSHSCQPNAIWHEGPEGLHIVRARMDIKQGEELCISYLAEDVLLHSIYERRRSLKKTKRFTCSCERCTDKPNSNSHIDDCRGFRCPSCSKCAVFLPRDLASNCRKALVKVLKRIDCVECGHAVGKHASGLLQAEQDLKVLMDKIDEERETSNRKIDQILTEVDVDTLLSFVGDCESGAVGPQHWLCDRLWKYSARWMLRYGRQTEALRFFQNRVDYHNRVFPWPNASTAWALERQAALLMKHFGLSATMTESSPLSPALGEAALERVEARVVWTLKEALQILLVMFGPKHKCALRVKRKLRRLQEEGYGEAAKPEQDDKVKMSGKRKASLLDEDDRQE
eukprot:TRINITY_DN65025_c0_g1_i1.p1 TRINITY_DN65025_c0_g1~~TRINITY_DN65025_c0_g1_i1.p1  ORF type:complete len:517 (-),score=69.58 TRINITY_DN65025_c0_g1_i1:245-1795(-)